MTNGYSNIYTLISRIVQFVSFAYGSELTPVRDLVLSQ
jgi:hypothetical protein